MEYISLYKETPTYVKNIRDEISYWLEDENITINEKLTVYFVPLKNLPGNSLCDLYDTWRWPVVKKNDIRSLYIYIIDPDAICDRTLIIDLPIYPYFSTCPIHGCNIEGQRDPGTVIDDAKSRGFNITVISKDNTLCMDGLSVCDHVMRFIEQINNRTIAWQDLLSKTKNIDKARQSIACDIIRILTFGRINTKIITNYDGHNLDDETIRVIKTYNMLVSFL